MVTPATIRFSPLPGLQCQRPTWPYFRHAGGARYPRYLDTWNCNLLQARMPGVWQQNLKLWTLLKRTQNRKNSRITADYCVLQRQNIQRMQQHSRHGGCGRYPSTESRQLISSEMSMFSLHSETSWHEIHTKDWGKLISNDNGHPTRGKLIISCVLKPKLDCTAARVSGHRFLINNYKENTFFYGDFNSRMDGRKQWCRL